MQLKIADQLRVTSISLNQVRVKENKSPQRLHYVYSYTVEEIKCL
jgi:hypothetical protein